MHYSPGTISRHVILASIAIGLIGAASATSAHLWALWTPTAAAACDFSTRVACSPVYISSFGYVAGLPIPVLLLVGYSIAAAVAMKSVTRPAAFTVTALYSLSVVLVALTTYQLFGAIVLRLLCLPCVGVFGASLVLFGMLAPQVSLSAREFFRQLLAMATRPRISLTVGSAIIPLVAGAALFSPAHLDSRKQSPIDGAVSREALTRWFLAQPRVLEPRLVRRGAIVLATVNDYLCPACRDAHLRYQPVINRTATALGTRFKYLTIDFPLDQRCNRYVAATVHPLACEAAVAARVAARHGGAELFSDWLFKHQSTLSPEKIWAQVDAIARTGDAKALYTAVAPELLEDLDLAHRLAISGTPTFYLDGRLIGSGLASVNLAILLEVAASQAGIPYEAPTNR